MYFIAGITGHVGGTAARQLLARGKQVRTLARTPDKAKELVSQGVEVRQGDLNDPAALASALEGVEGAFLLMQPTMAPPADFSDAKASLASYTAALAQSPVPRLVALSSMGSEKTERLGNITATSLMERAFSELPFPCAFVRAGSFYENYAGSLAGAKQSGVYHSFQPVDLPFPTIGTEDIGKLVAELLITGWTGKKVIELGTRVTPNEQASAIGKAIGREVKAETVPREAWAHVLQSFGMPPGATGPYEQMMESVNTGWITFGQPGTGWGEGATFRVWLPIAPFTRPRAIPEIDGRAHEWSGVRARAAYAPSEAAARTPAVALTAYTRASDRTAVVQAGFQAHVPKPVDSNELIATLINLVGRAAALN